LNPVLGQGFFLDDANSSVRRYDQGPKVYPVDITGQVHNDGEIICGAWWDTYLLLGNDMTTTLELFSAAFPGLQADVANGNEGQALSCWMSFKQMMMMVILLMVRCMGKRS
jgi:hypothetical protein